MLGEGELLSGAEVTGLKEQLKYSIKFHFEIKLILNGIRIEYGWDWN